MSDDIAIRVENLGKRYIIGREAPPPETLGGRLRQLAGSPFSWLATQMRAPSEEEILWALKDVSFEVKRGEVLGVIGRNGAGKSTLLKILSRITEPTTGHAEIHGRVGSLLEVGTGMHPELTGRENIYLNGTILGMRKAEIDAKFDEIVDFSGIERFLDTPVKRYSSGMRVRLGFAIAAHLEPEILVIDEVLAVGDAEFQKKCLGKMKDVAGHGRTVLFVSHNMTAVKSLCGSCIRLDGGQIASAGETESIVTDHLEVGRSVVHCQEWAAPDEAPGTHSVRVKQVRLEYPGDAEQKPLRTCTPLTVRFQFWNVGQEGTLNLSLQLYAADAGCVFTVTTTPRACDRGLWEGVCQIPANLLNDGLYSVRMLIVEDGSKAIFSLDDALVFEVQDFREFASWHGRWKGAVRPVFIPFSLSRTHGTD
jgi:lipopolysaccharide transport system ATP-binding protein